MGNPCCRPEWSFVVWARGSSDGSETEEEIGSKASSSSCPSSRAARSSSNDSARPRRVKVVMKRKELEQLLQKADAQGELSAQDVADWLTGPRSHNPVDGQDPSWRPALTSIPEIIN
ncbi:hypothetical protein MLD38_027478 [Melastoma candidum]|uniref:Uncharacterized protein n=1 Tax=Melastoma candidum TaxID=119954 RepID=A0ACB9P1Q8_9MYRT|nr:hypothetical protein MLD38_027478 [Melastoma candidum]